MKAKEMMSKGRPEVYLDLDGVVADFFDKYAELAIIHLMMEKYGKSREEAFGIYHSDEQRFQDEFGIRSYRDIPPAKGDPVLDMMIGTEFFNQLPKFSSADTLVSFLIETFGSYKVLSSPLRGDFENSEKWKKAWVARELNPPPSSIIIESRKEKYAKQPDGTPNILIDDRGNNITKWEGKGGIGIKYQADENGLDTVYKGIERAFKIVKGEEEHIPQVLKSIDRTQTIATGDDEKKEIKEAAENKQTFIDMFQKFLPLTMTILDLDSLPAMKFEFTVEDDRQPTFGRFDSENNILTVALGNRHPNDILRTIAHELVHYKQGTLHQLDDYSGETGSNEENEANALAGVIMRHFNKQYPEFLKQKPIISELEERRRKKKKRKWAAYGPGPYGWYGYDAGYSGDGGGDGGVGESLSWSSLDDGLSVEDKISIFEEYLTKGNLIESNDDHTKKHFLSLFNLSDTPKKNEEFIVAPLALVKNQISVLDKPSYLTYLGKLDGQMIFTDGSREIRYPSKAIRDLSIFNTFTFSTNNSYDKFRTMLALKFNSNLPSLMDKESVEENFADGKVKGKSRPGRVKKAGASCKGSVSDLRSRAKKYGGEKGKMYRWCLNMKAGRQKKE